MTPERRARLVLAYRLARLVAENTPTRIIAQRLRMTERGVYRLASEQEISLKPTNQSPRTSQPEPERRRLRAYADNRTRMLRRRLRAALES